MRQNVTDPTLLSYFHDFALCGDCFKSCKKTSGTYSCKLCSKYFHKNCNCKEGRNRTHYAQRMLYNDSSYICEKCLASIFPFYESDDIDLMCALFG